MPLLDAGSRARLGIRSDDQDEPCKVIATGNEREIERLIEQPADVQPLIALEVNSDDVPSDSYYHTNSLEFRSTYFSSWPISPEDCEFEQSPLLSFSRLCDDPSLRSLLIYGASLRFSVQPQLSIDICFDESQAIQRWLRGHLSSAYGIRLEMDVIDRDSTSISLCGWESPRFLLGRVPYYNVWQLRETNGFPQSFAQAAWYNWFKWAEATRSHSQMLVDMELIWLFVGAMMCLPALMVWRDKVGSNSHYGSNAVVSNLCKFLLTPKLFDQASIVDSLHSVGVRSEVHWENGNVIVVDHLNVDDLSVLELLVPPRRLITPFVLDRSPLDQMWIF